MSDEKMKIKDLAQLATPIFIVLIGGIFTHNFNTQQEENRVLQKFQQEENRKAQLALQLMSQREKYEIEFRQRMFEPLVEKLLNPDLPVSQRVTMLKLFQHNFHDVFNARALFDVLEEAAEKELPSKRDEIIKDLVSLAKDITEEQERLIGAVPVEVKVILSDTKVVKEVCLPPEAEQHKNADDLPDTEKEETESDEKHPDHNGDIHRITIIIHEIQPHYVRVQVKIIAVDDECEEEHELEEVFAQPDTLEDEPSDTFKVSYYDAPLTDNILLRDGHRFAITLKKTNTIDHPLTATLNVFEFPADYVTTGYRPTIGKASEMFKGIE